MTDEIMEDMLTWRHCAECEGPCDPKHRAEYSLFKKTDGGTFGHRPSGTELVQQQ